MTKIVGHFKIVGGIEPRTMAQIRQKVPPTISYFAIDRRTGFSARDDGPTALTPEGHPLRWEKEEDAVSWAVANQHLEPQR